MAIYFVDIPSRVLTFNSFHNLIDLGRVFFVLLQGLTSQETNSALCLYLVILVASSTIFW